MAIGDPFAVYMGTAEVNRQPSSGVSEQVSAINRDAGTDAMNIYDGTTSYDLIAAGANPGDVQGAAASMRITPWNMAIIINNTVYIRKRGTTDKIYAAGVIIDA